MPLHDVFAALQATPVGQAISQSSVLFPTIETVHVFALATVLGSIAIVDFRLLGVASSSERASELLRRYTPWTWAAFALAAVSGSLLFVSRAADYTALPVFWWKFGFMALAGLNMAAFHFGAERRLANWDVGPPSPAARIAGALSLAFWAAVVVCARQVGFHM